MFTIDTHVHTQESSSCGREPAADMVAIYADAGYDAIVTCDHYFDGFFHKRPDLDWAGRVDEYLAGYRAAREAGEKSGLKVFLGVELRLLDSQNDYLVFGLDEDFLYMNPKLYRLPMWEAYDLLDQAGALLIHAHPFRPKMTRVSPSMLHGVEVLNGHPNHPSDNPQALQWARETGLLMTGGSDAHFREGAAVASMLFDREIADGTDLAQALRQGEAAEIRGPGEFRLALKVTA